MAFRWWYSFSMCYLFHLMFNLCNILDCSPSISYCNVLEFFFTELSYPFFILCRSELLERLQIWLLMKNAAWRLPLPVELKLWSCLLVAANMKEYRSRYSGHFKNFGMCGCLSYLLFSFPFRMFYETLFCFSFLSNDYQNLSWYCFFLYPFSSLLEP